MTDPGTTFGDPRLNIKVHDTDGNVEYLYTITEENGPVQVKCRACDTYIDGDVTDISNHEKESDHRKLLANGKWQLYGHTAGDSFKIKQEKVKVKPKETSNYPEKSEKPTLLSLTVSDSTSNSPESKNMKLYTEKENKIRCTVCDVTFAADGLISHHKMMSHWSNLNREKWEKGHNMIQFTQDELLELLDLDGSKVFFDATSPAQRKMEEADAPVIGAEYLVEIQDVGNRQRFKSNCFICDKMLNQSEINLHLTSANHRLKFLNSFFPTVRRKFTKVPNLKHWQAPAYNFLESVANSIQGRFGRNKILSVVSEEYYKHNMEKIKAMVEYGRHARESEAMNFATIPDPFGSFIKFVPLEAVLNFNVDSPVRPKAGVSLIKEYQNLDGLGTGNYAKLFSIFLQLLFVRERQKTEKVLMSLL